MSIDELRTELSVGTPEDDLYSGRTMLLHVNQRHDLLGDDAANLSATLKVFEFGHQSIFWGRQNERTRK